MYKPGIESNSAHTDGAAHRAELPDTNPDQGDVSESVANNEAQKANDAKVTLVRFKKTDGSGRYEGRFLRHKEKGEGRHRLKEGELTFDELMAQYDDEINRLKSELDEIIKEKEQAIANISPKSEPQQWVDSEWKRIRAQQEQDESKSDEKAATGWDDTDTDEIPIVSIRPEDQKTSVADEGKTDEIKVVSQWPGGDGSTFTTTLPAPAGRQVAPQTSLKPNSMTPPRIASQDTEVINKPKSTPARSSVVSRSKNEHKQVKKETWQERLRRNKNKVAIAIGGLALGALLVADAAILTSNDNNNKQENGIHLPDDDNDRRGNGIHPPAITPPVEQVPDFAADGIVTSKEMANEWVWGVYENEGQLTEMPENARSAINSGDATVVYQWNGTYFYKLTPKAMNSFGLHGDPTSTQNVMTVLAAHSDGEIKIAP